MFKKYHFFLLLLLIVLLVPLASACGTKDNPNDDGNDQSDRPVYYLNSLEDKQIVIRIGDVYQIKYETNITSGLTWTPSKDGIVKVNEKGVITGISRGNCFISGEFEDLVIDVNVKVIDKAKEPQYLTVVGQDRIKLRDYRVAIGTYLKELFGPKGYREVDDSVFVAYYLEPEFINEVNLNEYIGNSLSIYPKYEKDKTMCDLMFNLRKIYMHNDEVAVDSDIKAFSADFGDTVKYKDITYEDCMLITVRYDYNKNSHFVTDITLDGNKANTKIPYDGFVIMVPKTNDLYNNIRTKLKVNDQINLNNYSINLASKVYVNKEKVEVAEEKINFDYANVEFLSVYDATNNYMIYHKQGNLKAYPASTTKIITALAALQHASLDTVVTIGDELYIMNEGDSPSTAGLHRGEKWTIRQLLYATLLPSGNDAAYSLGCGAVRSIPGNENKPIREIVEICKGWMNDVAKQVGANNSHFMVPDGNSYYNYPGGIKEWDDRITNHYVTSDDMIKFGMLALNYPGLAQVVNTSYIKFNIESGKEFESGNTNQLLNKSGSNYYPYAVGIKTGTTNPAGACLVSAAYRNDRLIIIAAMKNYDNRAAISKDIYKKILG